MRASRLLSLLLLLQNRGRMTAARLAAELEVSERTIYRDVESLSAAGIPIYADRGTGGGYQLLDGYRTRLTGLTDAEADSLFLSGVPDAAAELGLGAEMAAAGLKLLAALPDELRDRAERVRERFHLDAPGWFRRREEAPYLGVLATAVWECHTVEAEYLRRDGREVRRTLDPLGLVLKGGSWYVLARPHTDRPDPPPRTFRVARLRRLVDTGRTFQRPADFDLAGSWAAWAEQFESSRYRMTARVRITARARELMLALSSTRAVAAVEAAGEPGPEGWVELELPIESVDVALVEFSGYGPDIEVLDPPELRDRLAAAARATVRLYDAPAPEAERDPVSPPE
ncbi:helix-turn-helix transcriptional regulator [Marinitenerispora sediminis]|uniref:Transcriptional regulator n=1 Tax=Marinitenerispora sediminis TaxID=1931232 RepID=A0A368SZX3_9ACTN|nr:WYL domain-containing protein [Marinitenerispora sediminis]RCV47846.1 transcriptional regulator [Marinitenerispora sediminis]RCV48252.1 transcriptional regulator [Marinitenerispora sediminis]RCV51972.1 transcriptional regulator [Marinitenerispora sediminis]